MWWARLDALGPDHLQLLDSVERARRVRFLRAADRDRFTLGAALLRLAAAAELGTRPEELRIDRTCSRCVRPHGRPQLVGSDLHVSVSHAGDLVGVATTRLGHVGLDIEQLTDADFQPLLRHVLAPGEADVSSREDFFAYWTRKESILKATGDGLLTEMTDVVVSPPCAAPRLLGCLDSVPTATMVDLAPTPGYVGALTVLASGPVSVTSIGCGLVEGRHLTTAADFELQLDRTTEQNHRTARTQGS